MVIAVGAVARRPARINIYRFPTPIGVEICVHSINEVQVGLPLIQKMMAMEADDNHEESKSDEEAIAEAYRNMKTSSFVTYRLEWREER